MVTGQHVPLMPINLDNADSYLDNVGSTQPPVP